jgi:glutamine synthetase
MAFSGKSLVRGEPDASSLPSGGLRATFEARGYTVWDTTSYAFIKEGTLYIPTAFCGWGGEALDMKTPLLRSMETLNEQALRILRCFGNETARRVIPFVGAEQEYFLIDKEIYKNRPDLVYTGRTLFGKKPPKGQELGDHYFGKLLPRVAAFMTDLDNELWKLGIYCKTKHNEVAPAQHELAPEYTTVNVATDHNQLTMEMLKRVADRHNLACLLPEKPFAGVNGPGKHINWSLATDTGINLLNPGDTPFENAQFLLFLTAVVQAVDEHAAILRASVASPGNDHRLGGHEAPPAIISMFLGSELTAVLEAFEAQEEYRAAINREIEIGVTTLPHFPRDATDRNRTSPFAFTGNKFEFRMPGASTSVAHANIVLNTAVADVLARYADELEKAADFKPALDKLIRRALKNHKRVIFNGNNYSSEWHADAAQRGLPNAERAVDAIGAYTQPESLELFERRQVFTNAELTARAAIHYENYVTTLQIEAAAMLDIVRTQIIPACLDYQNNLAALLTRKLESLGDYDSSLERYLMTQMTHSGEKLQSTTRELETLLMLATSEDSDAETSAHFFAARIIPTMDTLRNIVDTLEGLCAKRYWPIPSYGEIFNSVG